MFEDMRSFIDYLREEEEVVEVREELTVHHEIGAAIKFIAEKYDSVAIFHKVKGYRAIVAGNLLGARRRLAMAMGVEEVDLPNEYLKRRTSLTKPLVVNRGPVKENILSGDIDIIRAIPVLTHHEKDAGPYFTTGVVISKDPETGIRGMGIHRIQVKGPRILGIFLNTPPVATFLEKAERMGKPLEIAVALGLDPVTFFSSVVWAPEGIDKFDIAGALSAHSISLVKCESVDQEVPATAEFVLEGRLLPGKREPEGPFGESSGYYFTFNNPLAEIEVISHRNEPIYHALMPFAGEEEVLIDFSWQMENKNAFLKSIPGLKDVCLHHLGSITVAQIAKQKAEDGIRVIKQIFDCGMPNKVIIVVDEDVDIYSHKDVWWAIATRFQPDRDVVIGRDMPGLGIDPSTIQSESISSGAKVLVTTTSKIGLDATKPLGDPDKFERIRIPTEIRRRVERIVGAAKGEHERRPT